MNTYCPNCGNKNSVVSANFCPKCGQNLKTLEKSIPREDDFEEEIPAQGSVDIERLAKAIKVKVSMDNKPAITVGELLEISKGGQSEASQPRPAPELPDGDDLVKSLMRECSPSKSNSKEVG